MKTGILCHGRYLQANNWELHQFGDPKNGLVGQILKTMLVAYKSQDPIIVFGTGASEKDGLKEAEYTIKYMFDNFDAARNFPQFRGVDLDSLKRIMKSYSVPELKSKNTLEEIRYAGEIFASYGVEKAIIISNPDHISRCMQLGHQIYQETKNKSLENLFGAQSEIGYNGTNIITSKIIEMPHRSDDSSPDLSKYIGNYFKLPVEKKKEFVEVVKNLLHELK